MDLFALTLVKGTENPGLPYHLPRSESSHLKILLLNLEPVQSSAISIEENAPEGYRKIIADLTGL